jgi:hypothetical protein
MMKIYKSLKVHLPAKELLARLAGEAILHAQRWWRTKSDPQTYAQLAVNQHTNHLKQPSFTTEQMG